ncbi:uncharacterized protein METZ01_LOCUS82526 [marine metagenome]|uniref:Uncharacterized protein n=1 Tax=marine metagenome TaxID=408172 RepID=A0A381UND9_9ZZZZ
MSRNFFDFEEIINMSKFLFFDNNLIVITMKK